MALLCQLEFCKSIFFEKPCILKDGLFEIAANTRLHVLKCKLDPANWSQWMMSKFHSTALNIIKHINEYATVSNS